VIAAMLLAILRGVTRQLAFLAANIIFVWGLLLGPNGAISTTVFCLLGYALTYLILWRPRWSFPVGLTGFVILFIYMRDYEFLHWALPESMLTNILSTVGLSFLLFKIIHVMIEARSGTLGSLEFLTYLNYCLNFTTFMMGPIQRYQDYYAQWHGQKQAIPLRFDTHLDAVLRILVGLFKAYVVADRLAPLALAHSPDVLGLPLTVLLLRIYAFYFFLYFNFAGYCDVVVGIGSLLGVRPPENFNKPFLARNISEFWLRFHMSLTAWLTDYVFSPAYKWALERDWLAFRPLLAMNIALLSTMIVSGLWHGTTLSFLLFGLTHGVYFIIYRTWDTLAAKRFGKKRLREWRRRWGFQLLGMFITFNAVAFSLVFFRLDAKQALQVLARFFGCL
jgi:alginate O-acetyltransferase complex protein AlgI